MPESSAPLTAAASDRGAVGARATAAVRAIGNGTLALLDQARDLLMLLGQLTLDLGYCLRHPTRAPWKELSACIYQTGAQALGITALVGLLIGVVLSYLSSQQLRTFGAGRYIIDILGISIVRELGPVLAAILVAGRSGSAITAKLGVMRVTQELDAMRVMGLPHGRRLVLPRVAGLTLIMPMLVLWTDAAALLGGMLAARTELGIQLPAFAAALPDAISLQNYAIGLGKGAVFGALVALIACHHGMRIAPNTESLGRGTTASVVSSITAVILADALFAILFRDVGIT